jgi:menaquinone-dependent protoporphyrinogen oxidase
MPGVRQTESGVSDSSILVAYETRFGSSGEIAEAIADEIGGRGCRADALRMRDARGLDGYTAAILGGPVNRGHWMPEAMDFVRQHADVLRQMPVALFCTHISRPAPDVRVSYLSDVRAVVRPVCEVFFAGRFDRHGAALLIPKALAWLVPPIDLRNWKAIRGWARDVVPLLQQGVNGGAA